MGRHRRFRRLDPALMIISLIHPFIGMIPMPLLAIAFF